MTKACGECEITITIIKLFYTSNLHQITKTYKKKRLNQTFNLNMASTGGLEPSTARLEGVCSIQLSYVDTFHVLNYNSKINRKVQPFFELISHSFNT